NSVSLTLPGVWVDGSFNSSNFPLSPEEAAMIIGATPSSPTTQTATAPTTQRAQLARCPIPSTPFVEIPCFDDRTNYNPSQNLARCLCYNQLMRADQMATGAWVIVAALLPGCAPMSDIPASLQTQVDHTLTFSQLKESPPSYKGHLVLLGGEVLTAKRLKEGTRIEVLQLPLDGYQTPDMDRTTS